MKTFTQYLTEAAVSKALIADVEAALAHVRSKGLRVPNFTVERKPSARYKGMYSVSNDRLWVNVAHGTKGTVGWNSTDHKWHTVFHEIGHMAHSDAVGSRYDNLKNHTFPKDALESIRTEVSKYATTNGLEFVAEVFAGLLAGKTFSDVVMRQYKLLDGPMV
jgi:hypothetical protein